MIMNTKIGFQSVIVVFIGSTFSLSALAEELSGIFIGVSTARVTAQSIESVSIPISIHPILHEISPSVVQEREFDDSTLAIEIGVPIRPWLSVDFVATGVATTSGLQTWPRSVWPVDPDAPFGPSVPATVSVRSESRSFVLSTSASREFRPQLTGYARLGVTVVQSEMMAVPEEEPTAAMRFESTDTRPWLALGARYRFDSGFTLNAEFGAATEGNRMARLGVGWTF